MPNDLSTDIYRGRSTLLFKLVGFKVFFLLSCFHCLHLPFTISVYNTKQEQFLMSYTCDVVYVTNDLGFYIHIFRTTYCCVVCTRTQLQSFCQ